MRPFLAFDTATDHIALAVGDLDAPGAVLADMDFPAPRAANTVLLPAAERLLAVAGLEPGELAAIACGRGPGSFTGVRIAVATAKGFAQGLHVPLVGFGTLDAVAERVAEQGLLGVLGDAMRGEVYPALFRLAAGERHRLTEDRVARPADVASEWASLDEPIQLSGNALGKHRGVVEEALGERASVVDGRLWTPDGPSLVAAAWSATGPLTIGSIVALTAADASAAAPPGALQPVYTRLSDAEEAERAGGSRSSVPRSGVAGPEKGVR